MAKKCDITNKQSVVGGSYSNRVRATQFNPTGKRRRYPNIQKQRIFVPEIGKTFSLDLSTSALREINKNGAFKVLKKVGIIKDKHIKYAAKKGITAENPAQMPEVAVTEDTVDIKETTDAEETTQEETPTTSETDSE